MSGCVWICKDTNLKANHNAYRENVDSANDVYGYAKILI